MAGVPELPSTPMAGAPEPRMTWAPEQDQRWCSLAEEATCPICLGYFTEPVSVHCGHTFCTPCITRYWQGVHGPPYPCPQCRETAPTNTLRPNWQAASMVQILAQGAPVAPPREGHVMYTEHDEKLKLFCQEDQTPICVICRESREHQDHKVRPVLEAAREYKNSYRTQAHHRSYWFVQETQALSPSTHITSQKSRKSHQDKFQSYLDDVKRELENNLGLQRKEEAKLADLEVNFRVQHERITRVFTEVQQFLEKEKCRHLSTLEEEKKTTQKRIRDKVTKLGAQQTMVRDQITEIEAKCQQPAVQLLKDVKTFLRRFEEMKCQYPDSGNFKDRMKKTEKKEDGLEEEKKAEKVEHEEEEDENEEQLDVKKEEALVLAIKESLVLFLEWRWARSFSCAVTLDPDTASRWLVLSADGRSARLGDRALEDPPDTPERFDPTPCVLGRERLSAGRHYWEVGAGGKTRWTLGVCDESVSRKGLFTLSPDGGYWAVGLRDREYLACTSPRTHLTPSAPPRVLGLFLDHERGRLSVFNVSDRSLLFSFSGAPFPPTLRTFFCPCLTEGGVNAGALRVLPVTEQE